MWYIILAIFILGSLYGLWLLFKKAGKQGWEAIVPFYREYVMAQLTARPTWWVFLLLVPIVNIFIFYALYFDLLKSFGKRRFWETAVATLLPFIYLPLWGRDPNVKYLGQSHTEEFKKKYPYHKSTAREWADAIIFATVAASLIRGFLIEAYMIPTGSMERRLLIGDFLFVSKLNYGPRIPMTPLAFPFAHHTMPLTGGKAYSEMIKIPYKRLPGFQEIKRNDVVVFNFPMEADAPYNRPVDKRENYIKRAVAISGDVVEMKKGKLFINGDSGYDSNDIQHAYLIYTDGSGLNIQRLIEKRFEYAKDPQTGVPLAEPYLFYVTEEEIAEVKQWSSVREVIPYNNAGSAFPHDQARNWDFHNFGPLQVPKAGDVVTLNAETLPIYARVITVYEGNALEQKQDGIYINGQKTDSYTVKMNYYWMMGDNRDNSSDSREFGFVPEDHIVGKALFTWMSWDEDGTFLSKIRWNRIFKGIK
ncbi:signal peptidase I [Sphingobacterium wenxiniae]|uniref:Signal peptidase I n=1 Tax=Sphingobacterium wenxiniae TaxID=683125 RepID=A0A1I6UJT3_9SPHI|nr:signal peptidase I [Sphingobacterium wenxiniae]SFT01719.1 signal peptidase I [Sphingobacterium wenxiniae]